MASPPFLEARDVTVEFPGVKALRGASASVRAGEVLAICGENGAGKSSLMKVLAGIYQPTSGSLLLDGKPVTFPDVNAASKAGVALIHQELNLADNLSVADNLFLGREPLRWGFLLDRTRAERRGAEVLGCVGLPPEVLRRRVGLLPPGQKQLVEVARALVFDARAIIMDEPTSSLTHHETETLYGVIADLKGRNVAVVFISHRLNEIKRSADRVLVLRDGLNAGELARDEISHDKIVRMMVGRELSSYYPRDERQPDRPTVLALKGLRVTGFGPEVTLDIRAGEILGMAGLVGAGRTELAEACFGQREVTGGTMTLDGKPYRPRHPREAIDSGVLLVPEDRRLHGLLLDNSVGFNLSLPNLGDYSRFGLVGEAAERAAGEASVAQLKIKTPSLGQRAGLLSGGNQQKIVFGKWLARPHRVLILDEPTRGVDVGAKAEIYALMNRLAGEGVAVWMISSDMEEVLGMSDRVAVMHEGRISGVLGRSQLGEEAVMNLATGGAGP